MGVQSNLKVRSEAFTCIYQFAQICLEYLFVFSEKVSDIKYLDLSEKKYSEIEMAPHVL